MSLARTVAWNTIIQVTGRILGLVVSMALTAILTRHLGLGPYGQMVAASTYVAIFTILADAGVYLVAVRRAAQEPQLRPAILGTALGLRLVLALVPLALGTLLVLLVPESRFPTYVPAVKLAVAILAVNAYFTLLNQFLIAIFRLHLRMDLAVLGEMGARLVALGATLAVVAMDGGLIAAILALCLGNVANFVYAWFVSRRFEKFGPRLDRDLAGTMLRESAVLAVVTLLGLVHFKVDTLLLSVMRSAEEVGIYGVAYKVHEVLITFPGLFVGLLYPVFARLATEDPGRLRHVFQRAVDVLLVTSVSAAALVLVVAVDLAALLGAPPAERAMRILAFALPPVFVNLGLTHLLLAEARQRWLVPLYALLVLANVGGNLFAIRAWSYVGAAATTVATESLSLVCLLAYWLGRRRWRLAPRALAVLPLAAAVVALMRVLVPPSDPESGLGVVARILRLLLSGGTAFAFLAAGIVGLRIVPLATLRALAPGGSRLDADT